eukprot:Clim_evm3s144 gene=Clim_evmTU3s144
MTEEEHGVHIFLIDGTYELFRGYHALPPLTAKDGRRVEAAYALLQQIVSFIRDYNVSHIGVAFDGRARLWRSKLYPGYKVKRPTQKQARRIKMFERLQNMMMSDDAARFGSNQNESHSSQEKDVIVDRALQEIEDNESADPVGDNEGMYGVEANAWKDVQVNYASASGEESSGYKRRKTDDANGADKEGETMDVVAMAKTHADGVPLPIDRSKLTDEEKSLMMKFWKSLSGALAAMDVVLDGLKYLGVHYWVAEDGNEADDYLASAAMKFAAWDEVRKVTIVTADKDLHACASGDRVFVLNRFESQESSEVNITERYGVCPDSISDYLAFVGDVGDNIPSIPGISTEDAVICLRHFKCADKIPLRIKQWPDAAIQAVGGREAAREIVHTISDKWNLLERNLKLTRLNRRVPIRETPRDLRWKGVEVGKWAKFCEDLNASRLFKLTVDKGLVDVGSLVRLNLLDIP